MCGKEPLGNSREQVPARLKGWNPGSATFLRRLPITLEVTHLEEAVLAPMQLFEEYLVEVDAR